MTILKTFNKQNYQFPDGTTDEQIEKYFKKIDPDRRGVITDIGLSALDGVRDGVQATIGLVEDLGDTLGEKTGFYGVGFGNEEEERLTMIVFFHEIFVPYFPIPNCNTVI